MHQQWPWFKSNLDLIEMLLSKTEPAIAAHYDEVLVSDSVTAVRSQAQQNGNPEVAEDERALINLGASLRDQLSATETAVLKVTGNSSVEAAVSTPPAGHATGNASRVLKCFLRVFTQLLS